VTAVVPFREMPIRSLADAGQGVVHAFTGGSDGGNPDSVVLDGAGHLYGTAATGGGRCRDQGCGVVFKITL